jgi:hypothetical protein
LDPVYWVLGAAYGWGALPEKDATYQNFVPEQNDGNTPYTVTVKDVPVDAFWSVTLYDDKGWMPINEYNAYSFNNVTAKKKKRRKHHHPLRRRSYGGKLSADRTGMELHRKALQAKTGNP